MTSQVPPQENLTPLSTLLLQQVKNSDGVSFADFMEQALYHPEYGYYMAPRDRIGKAGDFFTSSSVNSLFGRLVARQLMQMFSLLGGGAFQVVEQGAGEGHLAQDILDAIVEEAPELYSQLQYTLVRSVRTIVNDKVRILKNILIGLPGALPMIGQ